MGSVTKAGSAANTSPPREPQAAWAGSRNGRPHRVAPVSRPAVLAASTPPVLRSRHLNCAGREARTTAGREAGATRTLLLYAECERRGRVHRFAGLKLRAREIRMVRRIREMLRLQAES